MNAMTIMFAAAIFLAGWLWMYLFVRQLLFNFTVAYPLIRRIKALRSDLIAPGANRYTNISVLVCVLISGILLFLVLYFCRLYLIISFCVGAVLCLVLLIPKLRPENRPMFESFCTAYCRFVPDDELRGAIFQKDPKKINRRLRELECEGTFVPELKD